MSPGIVFKHLCHNLSFWIFSQCELWSFVTIIVFEFCQTLSLRFFFTIWALSQFEFLSFVTISAFELCHNYSFEFCQDNFYCKIFNFGALSQFQFLFSFVKISLFFLLLSQFLGFEFYHNLIFLGLSKKKFIMNFFLSHFFFFERGIFR